ncbi:hypothetical protein ALISP_3346 [Alicycliphilus sp. B1]|nr:hypothetical protein ALISP_3346 [Alicycliphilus sp. B1]
MANHAPRAGKRQPKTLVRECNALLAGSGLVVRDWQLSAVEPVPAHKRFTLETIDGDDWDEVRDIYAFHVDLRSKEVMK